MLKFKKRKLEDLRSSFSLRYRHCNRCQKTLNIDNDEEIVCVLCGETFCSKCINSHQKYCYSTFD
ncbi:MAG: hypothetical protein ACFE9Z_01750 [Promethearchaeota archaeon]